jgi:hypothetical protein
MNEKLICAWIKLSNFNFSYLEKNIMLKTNSSEFLSRKRYILNFSASSKEACKRAYMIEGKVKTW